MTPKPTVGRIVHYYRTGDTELLCPMAAIVTGVSVDDAVWVTVFETCAPPTSLGKAVPFSTGPAPGCWTWPPRAP